MSTQFNEALQAELLSMKKVDLTYRESILKDGTLYDGYDEKMEAIHLEHAERLHQIVEEHGWPGVNLVGEEGAKAAFMLAQHAISNPTLQRSFLVSLSRAADAGEASKIHKACLQDRILYNEGKPLLYGLLFDWNDDGEMFSNVEDINTVNERRKGIGIKSTVQESMKTHRRAVDEEGGGPPKDIPKHREMTEQWAVRVGWRSSTHRDQE